MRIVFDHQTFSGQEYGGISRYFYEIANRIAGTTQNEVEIFAPLYINKYFHSQCGVQPRGVKIPRLPKTKRVVEIVNATMSRLLLKARSDVDVFHETYYAMADCRPRSAKRVITIHDMIQEKFPEFFPPWWDRARQFKAHAVRRADHVICVSENTRRDLMELLNVPEDKTSVVYHGYSLGSRREKTNATMGEMPYLLYVGHRGGYKNFESLLRVYARSPFLKNEFSMVCFGGGKFTARELELMGSLGLTSNKIKHVSGSDDVLSGLYGSATAFIYPSLYEGFGIPPLEAMALGCPVICANSSSLPEVVGEAAELFDPADESAMSVAIERVVSSPQHASSLVKRGRERIRQFSWEKCASDTFSVYKKVLQL